MIAIYGRLLAEKPSSVADINAAIYQPFSNQDYCRQKYMMTFRYVWRALFLGSQLNHDFPWHHRYKDSRQSTVLKH
jgi:hypothetical protein